MLVVDNVHIYYGAIAAVQGASLRVERGEMVGLIGHNGSGKTTTLRAITGLMGAREGNISFEGVSLLGRAPERIVRLGVSMVPEDRHIFTRLTVGENLRIGTTVGGRTRRRAHGEIAEMTDRFPVLSRYFDVPAGRLSGGEQQQLAIGRALLARPKLLLLDEPSLGLAPLVVDQIFEILRGLRTDGVTILLVEQNVRRTIAAADRTYVMRTGGQIVLEGTSRDLRKLDIDEYLGFSSTADVDGAKQEHEPA